VSPAATSSAAKSSSIPAPEAASANELAVASQTPFSVFFSSVGPGTEVAASTLPKMILPAGSAAIRSGVTTAAANGLQGSGLQTNGAPAGSSQVGGSQAVNGASGVTPNTAPQPSKDALAAASPSGSASAGQALHNNADQGSSNVAAVASSSAAAAPLAAAGAAVPAAPPGLTNDSSPKQETVPAGGAGSPLPAAPPTPATLPGPVQVAQLVSRVGQSEMRIGMNTSAFGGVEVRTVVHANDVGLIIGSEKGDLRGLLANEMPALANTLQQQNLRLSSVNFMQGFASSNNASGGESQQQRSFVPAAPSSLAPSEAMVDDSVEALPVAGFGGGGYGLNLSILA
jgi:hypothetical protein